MHTLGQVVFWLSRAVLLTLMLAACAPAFAPTAASAPTAGLLLPPTNNSPAPYPPPPTETPLPYPNGTPTPYPPGFKPTLTPSPTFPTEIPSKTPTPTLTPITVPPVQTVTAGTLPLLARDVLYLHRGNLKRWNTQTGQIETLVGPTADAAVGGAVRYQVSDDRRRVVFLRRAAVNSGRAPADIVTLDLMTGVQTVLYISPAEAQEPPALALSPDGDWVAYSPALTFTVSAGITVTYPSPLYVAATDGSTPPQAVAQCQHVTNIEFNLGCGDPLWARDGRALAWSDGVGLWWSDLEQPARLLVANYILFENKRPIQIYRPVAWAPDGRFLLTVIGHYEGSNLSIVDIQSGHVVDIPGSEEYGYASVRVTWITDGRLFLIRNVLTADLGHSSLVGEIWHVGPDRDALLLDQSFLIADDTKYVEAADIGEPVQLPDGPIVLAVLSDNPTAFEQRGLYAYTPGEADVHKLTGLPPTGPYGTVDVMWSPDGIGAIVNLPGPATTLYAPSDGSALYDLSGVLGDEVCCFTWLD